MVQFIGMCCNNRTLPPFFLPLVLQLLASLPRTGHSLQPLIMALNTAADSNTGELFVNLIIFADSSAQSNFTKTIFNRTIFLNLTPSADMDCSTLPYTALRFGLTLTDAHPLFKAACARALLNNQTITDEPEGLSQEVVSALIQAFLDNETPDRLVYVF